MTGSSVFDYVHAGDHAEIAEQLGLTLSNVIPSNSGGGGGSSTGSANQTPSQAAQGLSHMHSPSSPASATDSVDDGASNMNPDGKFVNPINWPFGY